ncbi:MAG: PKD domain-containing protein [Dehalococcoidales bacterium]|nr:PKD domain-containing protein [Dehalococcoidales bacterium]
MGNKGLIIGGILTVAAIAGVMLASRKSQAAEEEEPPAAPIAGFSANVASGDAPLTVQFTDTSSGEITARLWDFGDGATSTELNPSHVFTQPGGYTVALTVTGPGGSDAAELEIAVNQAQSGGNYCCPYYNGIGNNPDATQQCFETWLELAGHILNQHPGNRIPMES